MSPILKKYRAAAVNAEPGWFDLEESVRRTIHWINEAGENGCKLIAFPELCQFKKRKAPFRLQLTAFRDPRLPLLDVESDLPGEPPSPEEVS